MSGEDKTKNLKTPVYIAAANNGVTVNTFKERGIPFLMPGSVDDIPIFATVIHFPKSIGYCVFLQLGLLCGTYHDRQENIFSKVTSLTHSWDVPVGSFTFSGLNDDDKLKLIGYGLQEEVGRRGTYIGTPSPTILSSLLKMGPITTRAKPGNVSTDGYIAYITAIRGFQIYSSYAKATLLGSNVNIVAPTVAEPSDTSVNTVNYIGKEFFRMEKAKEETDVVINSIKSVLYTAWDNKKTVPGVFTADGKDLAPVDGIFFPYFPGMNTDDKSTIKHVFESLFLRCIGSTEAKAADFFAHFKTGVNNFAYTSAGHSLSHLYKGMQLSVQTEAIITAVLVNSVYHGFILQAKSLKVNIFGREHVAVPIEAIQKQLGQIHKKQRLLGEIVQDIVKPVKDNGKPVYAYTVSDIDTSRKFYTVYHSLDLDLYVDRLKSIRSNVDEVIFSDDFGAPSYEKVLDFVNFVNTGDHAILQKYPAYVYGGYFELSDRIAIGLSIFGPSAPSLSYGDQKDMIFTLPRDPSGDDPNLVMHEGKRPLQFLPFKMVPIRQAHSQWKSLYEKGEIRIPRGRKGKTEFTDGRLSTFRILADHQFMNVYTVIRAGSATIRDSVRLGKRPAQESNADRSNIKRARKETMEMEF